MEVGWGALGLSGGMAKGGCWEMLAVTEGVAEQENRLEKWWVRGNAGHVGQEEEGFFLLSS